MIMDLTADLEHIKKIIYSSDDSRDDDWRLLLTLAGIFLRGREAGIEHAVAIVQRRAVNPMPIVQKIRKPVR